MSVENLDKRFGVMAIEKGYITAEQLIEAMKIQIKEDLEGPGHRLLGEILRQEGFMTTMQVDEVLKSMGILPVRVRPAARLTNA